MSDETTFAHKVILEGGRELVAYSDQRDIAAWEMEPFGCGFFEIPKKAFSFARYVAWRGSRRAKDHAYTWAEWGEQCISVEELEDEAPADPGNPAASAGH